jgi:polyisoprenoid-binding protein YceI
MSLKASVVALSLFLGLAAPASASEWLVVPEQSTLTANGKYFFDFGGGSTAYDAAVTFGSWMAEISLDPNDLAQTRIHIEVDLASATLTSKELTAELQGPNWLNVAQNRKAVFDSAFVTFKGDNAYEAVGKLTLNGVTKDLTVPFEATFPPGEATATGTVTILRTDFGIGSGTDAATVASEVSVTFVIKATALTN